jgi:hypothetical protein
MPRLNYYVAGDHNAVCAECGRGFKFSELSKRWDNPWTCNACWEPRHPQDFVRAVRDDPSVPIARPRTGLPTNVGLWSNNISWIIPWENNNGIVIPWTA